MCSAQITERGVSEIPFSPDINIAIQLHKLPKAGWVWCFFSPDRNMAIQGNFVFDFGFTITERGVSEMPFSPDRNIAIQSTWQLPRGVWARCLFLQLSGPEKLNSRPHLQRRSGSMQWWHHDMLIKLLWSGRTPRGFQTCYRYQAGSPGLLRARSESMITWYDMYIYVNVNIFKLVRDIKQRRRHLVCQEEGNGSNAPTWDLLLKFGKLRLSAWSMNR